MAEEKEVAQFSDLPTDIKPETERYYYASFSYSKNRIQAFGNITTKIIFEDKNPNCDLIPSQLARRIKKENMLDSVMILEPIHLFRIH